jgi:hypothetical protein
MTELKALSAEVSFTMTVTRAETGKVEEYQVVGFADPEKLAEYIAAQSKPKE